VTTTSTSDPILTSIKANGVFEERQIGAAGAVLEHEAGNQPVLADVE
jgi:hypothetical protein